MNRSFTNAIRNIRHKGNSLIVKHTPGPILRRFETGRFKNNLTRNEHRPGYLPWFVTRFYINSLLWLCYISSQELNDGDLGQIFIEIRNNLINSNQL